MFQCSQTLLVDHYDGPHAALSVLLAGGHFTALGMGVISQSAAAVSCSVPPLGR